MEGNYGDLFRNLLALEKTGVHPNRKYFGKKLRDARGYGRIQPPRRSRRIRTVKPRAPTATIEEEPGQLAGGNALPRPFLFF